MNRYDLYVRGYGCGMELDELGEYVLFDNIKELLADRDKIANQAIEDAWKIKQLQAEIEWLKEEIKEHNKHCTSCRLKAIKEDDVSEIIRYAIGGLEVLKQNDGFMDIDAIIRTLEQALAAQPQKGDSDE